MVDLWGKQDHREAIKQLDSNPKMQLDYLLCFLEDREEYLDDLSKQDSVQLEHSEESKNYKEFILMTVKLLCDYKRDGVIKFVKKKYNEYFQ